MAASDPKRTRKLVGSKLLNVRNAIGFLTVAALFSSCSSTKSFNDSVTSEPSTCAGWVQNPHQTYKWTDADGTVHYGDRIPPEFAERPYALLNDQGVAVEELPPQKMPCTREQIEKHLEDIRRYQDDLERLQDGPEQYRSKEKEDSLARSE